MELSTLGGFGLIVFLLSIGGILFSRLLNPRRTDSIPAWVAGIPLALILVPAVLYLGARVFSFRISLSTITLSVVLLLVAAYLAGRSPVPRKR